MVQRIEHGDEFDAARVAEGGVQAGEACRVVQDGNEPDELQCIDDRLELEQLVCERISMARGLGRGTEAEKIERDDSPAGGRQARREILVAGDAGLQAVHEDIGRAVAGVVAHMKFSRVGVDGVNRIRLVIRHEMAPRRGGARSSG